MQIFRFPAFGLPLTFVSALICLSGGLSAQTPSWRIPSSGYVYDAPEHTVRQISGFIGAATIGASAVGGVDWASIAPNGKSAIVEQSGSLTLIGDLGSPAQSQILDSTLVPRQAFWSSDSNQAVMIGPDARLVWIAGLNGTPSVKADRRLNRPAMRVRAPQSAGWALLAADDSAEKVLLADNTGENSQLWLASSFAAPVLLPYTGRPTAAVFVPGGASAFVADAGQHLIAALANLNSSPAISVFLSSSDLVNNPAGLALSADGKRLAIADTGRAIHIIDVQTATPFSDLSADAAPTSLTAFAPDLFLLNPGLPAGQPLYLLDTRAPANVVFVPRGE